MAFESSSDAARKSPPCALVIFGASGDLTQRKLIPAIERLARRGRLPREFALVGVARSQMSDEDFAQRCRDSARRAGGETSDAWTEITDHIRYVCGGYDDPGTYDKLADVLHEADRRSRDRGQPRLLPGDASHRLRSRRDRPGEGRAQRRCRARLVRPGGHRKAVRS